MRREGYEFAVSKAEVLYHTDERGKKLEPMELAYIDVPDDCTGSVIQKLSQRKGELLGMSPINGGYTRLQFSILQEVLSDTEVNSLLILRVTVLSILLLKDMKNTKEIFLTERMVLLLLTKAVMLSLMVFSMRRKEVLSSSDLVRRYMPE